MISRPLWLDRIQRAWSRRSVVWLSGVRRVGKKTLARMLPGATYMNCDLPSVVRALDDPELFLRGRRPGSVLIFDEIHQLSDPSLLLKLAADEHPKLKVLATGSSTLAATGKFRDSLAGRKASVHLCPVLWEECASGFGGGRAAACEEGGTTAGGEPSVVALDRRLLHGGLPEALLAERPSLDSFSEWIDSFYARDILELFSIRNRQGFLALFRMLLRRSGGQLAYGRLASLTELSRPTVKSYIDALEVAHAVHRLRPFHGGGSREIVRRPKCYAFDTGFVAFERGWRDIRPDDRGVLWEHLVLDTLRVRHLDENVFYWQDKSRREVDFVVRRERNRVDLIECKIAPEKLNPSAAAAFRAHYPQGDNYVVTPFASEPYQFRRGALVFTACVPGAVPGDPSVTATPAAATGVLLGE